MAKIFKANQTIKVKIHDAIFHIAPLSLAQKNSITSLVAEVRDSQNVSAMLEVAKQVIKLTVKKVEGITDGDDEPYQVTLEDNQLTDECVEDLSNFEYAPDLTHTLMAQIAAFGTQPELENVVVNYKAAPEKPKAKK